MKHCFKYPVNMTISGVVCIGLIAVLTTNYLSVKTPVDNADAHVVLATNESGMSKTTNQLRALGVMAEIAKKNLEQIKLLRKGRTSDLFDTETVGLAEDVTNAARRISYFSAKKALVDRLKSPEQLSKVEQLISTYDEYDGKQSTEVPVLVHYGFIALGEASRTEGIERASRIYQGIAEKFSTLNRDESQRAIKAAKLTDIYDLTKNILLNQTSDRSKAGWPEITAVLDKFGVREHYLNHEMREEIKKAVSSVTALGTVAELENLNKFVDSWFNVAL